MKKGQPISPKEVGKEKDSKIPTDVIDVFNEMIVETWDGTEAYVRQPDVVKRIAKKMKVSRNDIFENNWLDVEGVFRKAGWKVYYDKPGYCETYDASFKFSKK